MINAITYEVIIKILGKFLDTYSGLLPTRILNADSIRGTDLSEIISGTEMYSPGVSTSFLLFELLENQNGDHFITSGETNNNMMTIQSYNYHIMIYGNQAPTDAQKISTLFKQSDSALELRDSGIFIKGVSSIEPINEFINNTLILRRDLLINLQVRYDFSNVGKDNGYFAENQDIITIVESVSKIKVS